MTIEELMTALQDVDVDTEDMLQLDALANTASELNTLLVHATTSPNPAVAEKANDVLMRVWLALGAAVQRSEMLAGTV